MRAERDLFKVRLIDGAPRVAAHKSKFTGALMSRSLPAALALAIAVADAAAARVQRL